MYPVFAKERLLSINFLFVRRYSRHCRAVKVNQLAGLDLETFDILREIPRRVSQVYHGAAGASCI